MTDPATLLSPAPGGLLAGDEPTAYELLNETSELPVLLVCDHASARIPRALDKLGLDEAQLARHIAWDIGIADMTRRVARRLGARAVLSRFSRLVIDPNRDLDDPTLTPQVADGVIVPGNRRLSPEARRARIEALFLPYHRQIEQALDALAAGGRQPEVVSMHSFTPVMKGVERPWQVGILWREDPRLPVPLMNRLRALGVAVGDNQPYSARNGHGHTLDAHAEGRGLANVLIEMRQDLIDTHHGAAEWAERVGGALEDVLAERGVLKSSRR